MRDQTVKHSQWVATGPDKQMQDTGNAHTIVFTLDVNGKLRRLQSIRNAI